ncbi:MAG: hypothetical protein JSS02_24390 [Planctomycetes bacterium]|nr:hypothetical protein [Planctomycetota bacterium]
MIPGIGCHRGGAGRRSRFLWLLLLVCAGCSGLKGPATTDTSSDTLPGLEKRVEFLERYVEFRRTYTDLGFQIKYQNNSGGLVPGPTEWDIRLVAVVPAAELAEWIPPEVTAESAADVSWLSGVPGAERAKEIEEWYVNGGRLVGVDRKHSVVAFHDERN